jgi:hypothetical protein
MVPIIRGCLLLAKTAMGDVVHTVIGNACEILYNVRVVVCSFLPAGDYVPEPVWIIRPALSSLSQRSEKI